MLGRQAPAGRQGPGVLVGEPLRGGRVGAGEAGLVGRPRPQRDDLGDRLPPLRASATAAPSVTSSHGSQFGQLSAHAVSQGSQQVSGAPVTANSSS